MSDPFLGEIRPVAFNFAPHAWTFCNGQILPINQNQALFSLLGTTYGGNGTTSFQLPDLRSRVPLGAGQGPGSSNFSLGERSGSEAVTLSVTNIPSHNHRVNVSGTASSSTPVGNVPATHGGHDLYSPTLPDALAADAISLAGGSQPHLNRQPYIGTSYIIALSGIFPSRP